MLKRTMALVCAAAALWAAGETVAPLGTYTPVERRYWVFQPRKSVAPPAISDRWIRTPIDAFILAALRKNGLEPAPEADAATLIRRVTYDLTGLPPTPEEIDEFLHDRSPQAWEKVVDRLLASPHYGEQWGRHWLDVVRFAESDGYEYDTHRPDAYRYRDYVVQSLNDDKPYDAFVREQLAGDEIDPANATYLVASGFNRLGPLRKNAGNQDVASSQNEVLSEMTNIVGAAFLGVTVGCARCHDHKFDPFRQSDYYRLQAHFAQTQPNDIVMASQQEQEEWKTKAAPIQQENAKAAGAIAPRAGRREGQAGDADRGPGRSHARAALLHLQCEGRPRQGDADSRAVPRRLSESGVESWRAAVGNPAARRDARSAARYGEAAPEPGELDRRPGESADRPHHGESHLGLPFRPRNRRHPTISAAWAPAHRIPNCSIGSPIALSRVVGS